MHSNTCVWTFDEASNSFHPQCDCNPGFGPGPGPLGKTPHQNALTIAAMTQRISHLVQGQGLALNLTPTNGATVTLSCVANP